MRLSTLSDDSGIVPRAIFTSGPMPIVKMRILNTCAGYLPAAALKSRRPRLTFCATPFTVSEFDCSGNDTGMPLLRWCVCALAFGRNWKLADVLALFQLGGVNSQLGFWLPV